MSNRVAAVGRTPGPGVPSGDGPPAPALWPNETRRTGCEEADGAFDRLVMGQVMPSNPAHSVRAPRHLVTKGVTPVLSSEEATALLTGMDVSTVVELRDRAVIAAMTYTFARVAAVVALAVEDYFPQDDRWWLRLLCCAGMSGAWCAAVLPMRELKRR